MGPRKGLKRDGTCRWTRVRDESRGTVSDHVHASENIEQTRAETLQMEAQVLGLGQGWSAIA
jgi:hypothetical protein